MRSRINTEPAFDPLTLFASEQPAARFASEEPEARATTTRKAAPVRRPPVFVEVRDPFRPPKDPSSLGRWSFAAAVLMVAGVLIGYASGYIAAPRVTSPAITNPQVPPGPVSAEPTQVATPVDAASTGAGRSGLVSKSTVEEPRVPVAERPAPPAERRVPAAAAITPRSGSIEVLSRPPGATVAVDGRVVGQTPLSIPNVPEGTHIIGIEAPGFSRWATSVHVERGKSTRVGASLEQ